MKNENCEDNPVYYQLMELIYSLLIKSNRITDYSMGFRAKSLSLSGVLENKLNGSSLIIPKSLKDCSIIVDNMKNNPSRHKINRFLVSSLSMIGGGAKSLTGSLYSYRRLGGSSQDIVNYIGLIKEHEKILLDKSFSFSIKEIASEIFGSQNIGKRTILPYSEIMKEFSYNGSTSPGTISKILGFKKKAETLNLDLLLYKIIYPLWSTVDHCSIKPNIIWGCASKPKLIKLRGSESKMESVLEGNPCSRLIAVGPTLEALLAFSVYHPVSNILKSNFKKNNSGIAIGCNRFGEDWMKMGQMISESKYVFFCDYSKYDLRISKSLLIRALDIAYMVMDFNDLYTKKYLENYKEWFIENIVRKEYNLSDVGRFTLNSGLPSGTIWTSTLNSIINVIVIKEVMLRLGIKHYVYTVYGDDNLIMINEDINNEQEFKDYFSLYCLDLFNLKVDDSGSRLCKPEDFFVGYERPIYKPNEEFQKGTRNLVPIRIEVSKTPFKSWDHTKGSTHRWNYTFRNKVRFLQYYWTYDYLPIRPMRESIMRVMHPEEEVSTLDEHEVLLISHLTDNFHNAHVRNWMYHLLYDVEFFKRFGIKEAKQIESINQRVCDHYDINNSNAVRLWYRRMDSYVDLSKSIVMQSFNYKWECILKMIEEIRSNDNPYEPYETLKVIKAIMSSGNLTCKRAQEWYNKRIISLRELTEFKYLIMNSPKSSNQLEDKIPNFRSSDLPVYFILCYLNNDWLIVNEFNLRMDTSFLLNLCYLKLPNWDCLLNSLSSAVHNCLKE